MKEDKNVPLQHNGVAHKKVNLFWVNRLLSRLIKEIGYS
jgi:hypothetical protein